jgi:hypothetical protein
MRDVTGVIMVLLIFLFGSLLGLVAGVLLCIRFVRQEVAGDIGPRLRRIQLQLDALEAEVGLVIGTRYAEVSAQLAQDQRRPVS